jgi:hypothetical protein
MVKAIFNPLCIANTYAARKKYYIENGGPR